MRFLISLIFLLMTVASCKDKYLPRVEVPPTGFLVVEGAIRASNGPTTIALSRTSGLDSIHTIFEPGATVDIQSTDGSVYRLNYQDSGRYHADQILVDPALQYRVHIRTSNGEEYISDYSAVKITPAMDSVNWVQKGDKVDFFVTTHDPARLSKYYQWTFEETWEFRSKYTSTLTVVKTPAGGFQVGRRPNDQIPPHTCWRTQPSTQILIASSNNLQADLIYDFTLQSLIPSADSRLSLRYSLIVRQNVLSKDGFEWLQKLKKNTESIGSIFDPQPSQTGGNFHCISNPGRPVIGFVECSSVVEQRIFINRNEITGYVNPGYGDCESSALSPNFTLEDLYEDSAKYYITDASGGLVFVVVPDCVDCRIRGGSSTPPSFW